MCIRDRSYISTPVMGGFISGIGCTIILMQVAKLFGGSAGTGELFVLKMCIRDRAGASVFIHFI